METRAATAIDEQVAAALLPVLLHRVNNTTQLLMGVRALLGTGDLPPRSSQDLARASEGAREEGWLLGVLAAGLGAEVALARHERDGLAPLLWLVRDGLRRVERDLAWDAHEVPQLVPPSDASAPTAVHVAWATASVLWLAGLQAERALRVRFECDGALCRLHGDAGGDGEWLSVAEAVATRIGGACASTGGAWTFEFPRGCGEPARDAHRLR